MKFLGIDTSRNIQSLTIFDTKTKAFVSKKIESKSSFFIAGLIEFLNEQKIQPQDISLLTIVTGPGSFTGIRTGISIVKTLASELDLKIFAANNFELIRYEKNFSGAFAIKAGLNDYYISLDEDYANPKTNFFSYELNGLNLVDFEQDIYISELLLRLYLQKQKSAKLLEYSLLEPYYLREPSVGKKL